MANLHFAQMHINKIKTTGKLMAAYNHNCRKEEVPNADINMADKNDLEFFGNSKDNYKDLYQEKIDKSSFYKNNSVRSNNVLALEIVCSFPKELADTMDIEGWKEASLQWAMENFNDPNKPNEQNIIAATFHGDEAGNPHMHIMAIPLRDGKLNAKSYMQNSIYMSKLQDSYAKACEKFNLARGIKGTRIKHETVKRFYGSIEKIIEESLPQKEKDETIKEYYDKINNIYKDVALKAFGLEKENERLKEQLSAISREPALENKIEHYQYVKKMKELEEKERSLDEDRSFYNNIFNDYNEIKKKATALDYLQEYLKDMEDVNEGDRLMAQLNKIIEETEKKKEEEKKREEKRKEEEKKKTKR